MKSNCKCNNKQNHITIKPIKPNLKNTVGFFLIGKDEAFLMIDDFPFDKLLLPAIGEKVNLESYGDFDFDYYIVKDIYHNLGNPERGHLSYIEVTVEGCFFDFRL